MMIILTLLMMVDKMAKKDPDKVAMLHISKDGKERSFTFL